MVMYVQRRGVFATIIYPGRKHVRREKLSQNSERHRIFLPEKGIP